MPVEVIIPALGEVVEEVVILQWFKREGDPLLKGEALLEVESEKVNTVIDSPASGILGKILYPPGSKVPITKVAAIILQEGEKLPKVYEAAPAVSIRPVSTGAVNELGREKPGDRVRVAPVARRMAEMEGIDLSLVKPTGPHGTIMKKDVEAYLAVRTQRPGEKKEIPEERRIAPSESAIKGRKIQITTLRKTIARRMSKAAFTAPHLVLFTEVRMDPLLTMREAARNVHKNPEEFKVSINDFLMKAVALTLRDYPYLNARWEDEEIFLAEDINIGLAVALEEGLVVPAIANVDRLGLEEIARQRLELVQKARQKQLQKTDLDRGTFTITSLANYGISHFSPILNPPQSAILSVGSTHEKVVLEEGRVCTQKFAVLGLAVDHRVADGAYGAGFLESLKRKLENPVIAFLHL